MLSAGGAGIVVDARDVGVLATADLFRRAGRDIVGAAERVVIAAGIDHGGLAALKAAGDGGDEEEQRDQEPRKVMLHASNPPSLRLCHCRAWPATPHIKCRFLEYDG